MKNILIPTDFSENSWNAIVYALQFFDQSPCNFYFLHVNTVRTLDTAENEYMQNNGMTSKMLTKPSKVFLQETVNKIKESFTETPNHRFFTISDHNNLIDSMREQVAQHKIDFIVMGTKGESGVNRLAIGSNAGNVITKVKCTTLVVPENAKYVKPKEIAFPTDFSIFYHPDILQPIIDIIDQSKSELSILNVNKSKLGLNKDQQRNKEYLDDYFSNYKHSFHFLTDQYIENAVQQFVDSKGVNLIAMLAKNLNYFQRILFHPAVNKISYYKDVPFLVLH